jgi:hypothetical protein
MSDDPRPGKRGSPDDRLRDTDPPGTVGSVAEGDVVAGTVDTVGTVAVVDPPAVSVSSPDT